MIKLGDVARFEIKDNGRILSRLQERFMQENKFFIPDACTATKAVYIIHLYRRCTA